MKLIRICALALAVLLCINIIACGGKKETKSESITITTTLGQELQDLERPIKTASLPKKSMKKLKKR